MKVLLQYSIIIRLHIFLFDLTVESFSFFILLASVSEVRLVLCPPPMGGGG